MISNQTVTMVQSTVRAAGATSPGDKRRLLDAVSAELGINPAESTSAPTDYVVPFPEAARRLGIKRRTLSSEITAGRIRAVRKCHNGGRPRSVGIAASEINEYIRRHMEVKSA
jgi:predicted DNA-binding transcriptional regulator AlpA